MFRRREDNLFDDMDTIEENADEASSNTASSAKTPSSSSMAASASSYTAKPAVSRQQALEHPSRMNSQPSASHSMSNQASGSTSTASNNRPSSPTETNRVRTMDQKPFSSTPSASSNNIATSNLATATTQLAKAKDSHRVLTVGSDILLKGEIATCDRLVIEGQVDATLKDVHTVEIAESGSFKGTAEIEYAEISGSFDGDLIVRHRLVIHSTGRVRGRISYGEIEIQRGGELTGEINTSASANNKKNATNKEKQAA